MELEGVLYPDHVRFHSYHPYRRSDTIPRKCYPPNYRDVAKDLFPTAGKWSSILSAIHHTKKVIMNVFTRHCLTKRDALPVLILPTVGQ